MKTLAIDYGTKHIGLALSNLAGTIAFPYKTLPNDARLMTNLKKIIRDEAVEQLVIGQPKSYKQTGAINLKIQKFLSDLTNLSHPKLPIATVDELLTSETSKKMSAGGGPARNATHNVAGGHLINHELAAMLILEQYLQKSVSVTYR